MLYVVVWWVIIQIIGLAALPLGFRLFRHLPDRGYTLAKPLGLLLVTYLFWLLGMLGFLRNTTASIVFCLVIVAAASVYLYHNGRDTGSTLLEFLRSHWKLALVIEVLFLAGFALWAPYRAYNPEISATEKPMEFAFLNGILRSDRFPPLDPWLSGFAISYYYFGYVMVALLTRLSGVPSSVAFNLGIALLFAWTLTGAFSVVYNLVAGFLGRVERRSRVTLNGVKSLGVGEGEILRFAQNDTEGAPVTLNEVKSLGVSEGEILRFAQNDEEGAQNDEGDAQNDTEGAPVTLSLTSASSAEPSKGLGAGGGERVHGTAVLFGLLGAWMVAIAGNLEGFFESLHSKGVGSDAFWNWLDIKNLAGASVTGGWYPTDNWWWWRASRVIHDRDFLGNSVEVIDEFPFFSFMLGDMHPHVLSLPFVLLALGLALNLILAAGSDRQEGHAAETRNWLETVFGETWWVFIAYALCMGAIGFLNTWDLPIYFVVLMGAFVVRRRAMPLDGWIADTVIVGLALSVLAFVLYLPFYAGFQSQAGGILPTLLFSTRWQQYLVMFGLPLFMVLGLVVVRWSEVWRRLAWRERLTMARNTVVLWVLLFVSAFAAMFLSLVPLFVTERGRSFLEGLRHNEAVRQMIGDLPWGDLLVQLIARRLASPWTSFFLALLLAVLVILLLRGLRRRGADDTDSGTGCPPADPSTTFALWITLMGLALTFSVEFVYLRDTFGTRMNTVFKFYYQAWLLLSLSGVYGVFYVLQGSIMRRPRSRPVWWGRLAWTVVLLALLGMSAVYPLLASYNKAGGFQAAPTLDGTAYMAEHHADDHAAIEWLNENVAGAPGIVEATGGSYSYYARVSAQTGLPTVLGWGGHELQWRGNYDEAGRREPDISTIYESLDLDLTLTLLDKYGIKYVYVGDLERRKYPQLTMAKFDQLFDVAYQNDSVRIYERRD